MKILAQSAVVSTPSYIHLGYVAGSHIKGEATTLFTGLLMLGIGGILCCRIFISKEFLSTIDVKKLQIPAWKWIVTGGMLITTGIFLVFISEKFGERRYSYPLQATPRLMENLVHGYKNTYKTKKISMQEYLATIPSRFKKDPWSQDFKIKVNQEMPELNIKMSSAGPDKNFGTQDDIIREYTFSNNNEKYIQTKVIPPVKDQGKAI